MKSVSLLAATLLALLWPNSAVRAEMTTKTQTEIGYLLDLIARSGCEFNSGGTWYGPTMARYHLRDKYEQIRNATQIGTAEDFIKEVASDSDADGQPYKVRCNGDQPVDSSQWLGAELARFRVR